MKKQNIIPIIALLALVSMMIVPVSATPSYTIVGSDIIGTDTFLAGGYAVTQIQSGSATTPAGMGGILNNPSIRVFNTELTAGTSSIYIHNQRMIFSGEKATNHNLVDYTFSVKFNRSTAISVGYDTNVTYGTGNVRLIAQGNNTADYGLLGADTGIYDIEINFDTWDPTPLTGSNWFIPSTTDTDLASNMTINSGCNNAFSNPTVPFMAVMCHAGAGDPRTRLAYGGGITTTLLSYVKNSGNFQNDIYGFYDASAGGKISIDIHRYNLSATGKSGYSNISIGTLADGYLTRGSLGYNNISTNTYSYPINISILDPASGGSYFVNNWFSQLTPPVTPTPTTTIPAGYVRSTFVTIDGVNYNTIHGTNIMLYDVENGSWSNSTSDADGIFYIDTLPYHTINAYATYTIFANHYADASIIGAVTGNSGLDHAIYMFPPGLPPGPGNINLYIPVVDADTTYAIGSVGVQVELPTGAITGDITGPGGDAAVFVVPNNTIIKARASKTGYGPVTESFNSGEVTPKTKTLYMSKLVVTPTRTSTIPPGGVTPVVTVDPRTTNQKDADMMDQIRDAGPGLIGLAIVATIFGLIKLMTKK
jgi:hypothetical protein